MGAIDMERMVLDTRNPMPGANKPASPLTPEQDMNDAAKHYRAGWMAACAAVGPAANLYAGDMDHPSANPFTPEQEQAVRKIVDEATLNPVDMLARYGEQRVIIGSWGAVPEEPNTLRMHNATTDIPPDSGNAEPGENERAILAAYARYDSDKRVNGPHDYLAFRAAILADDGPWQQGYGEGHREAERAAKWAQTGDDQSDDQGDTDTPSTGIPELFPVPLTLTHASWEGPDGSRAYWFTPSSGTDVLEIPNWVMQDDILEPMRNFINGEPWDVTGMARLGRALVFRPATGLQEARDLALDSLLDISWWRMRQAQTDAQVVREWLNDALHLLDV